MVGTTGQAAAGPSSRVVLPFARQSAHDEWLLRLRDVLAGRTAIELVYQPIVDLDSGGTAGYEALSRFPAVLGVGPDVWFRQAAEHGLGAELEALAIARALDARAELPTNCFLTVNVSPHLLGERALRQVLTGRDLRGLVVELTEHVPITDEAGLVHHLDVLRDAGAKIALDDAGSGYAGLQQMLLCRPDLIKLDRSLIAGIDRDTGRQAAAEALGALSDRLDAVLLAEGIETVAELRALRALGLPLGQGYLLGRPAAPWTHPGEGVRDLLRKESGRTAAGMCVSELLDAVPYRASGQGCPALLQAGTYVVDVDPDHRPVCVWAAPSAGMPQVIPRPIVLAPTTPVVDALRRMMTRPAGHRHLPALCTDAGGRYVGVLHHDRLTLRLIESLTPEETRT